MGGTTLSTTGFYYQAAAITGTYYTTISNPAQTT